MVLADSFIADSLPAAGGLMIELGFWLVAAIVVGYVLLLYAAFRMFGSDSNRKSVLGAALLLVLIALGLLPMYWLAIH
jgi:hypothetical protein